MITIATDAEFLERDYQLRAQFDAARGRFWPGLTGVPDAEIERRREAALKRMLSTPHQPQKPIGKQKASPKPQKRTVGNGRARVGKGRA